MFVRPELVRRYAAWLERRRWAVVIGSVGFAIVCAIAASRLEVQADFSYLLPQDVRSVVDLRAIGKRARALPPANLDAADAQRAYRHALGAINEARGQLGQLAGEIDSGVKANDRSKLWMLTAKTREHLDRQLIVIAGELDAVDSWVWYAEQRAAVAPVR